MEDLDFRRIYLRFPVQAFLILQHYPETLNFPSFGCVVFALFCLFCLFVVSCFWCLDSPVWRFDVPWFFGGLALWNPQLLQTQKEKGDVDDGWGSGGCTTG